MIRLMLVMLLGLVGCSSYPTIPMTQHQLIEHMRDSTVVLVRPTEGENGQTWYLPNCGGVWVGPRIILTAYHCVAEGTLLREIMGDSAPVDERVDSIVRFKTFEELRHGWDEELAVANVAMVAKTLRSQDLALLYVDGPIPVHSVAIVAQLAPDDGAKVHIIGHTIGYEYTYLSGTVSAVRNITNIGKEQHQIFQINSSAFKGNSGGGAFDENGNLVGICSFLSSGAPAMTFFVYTDALREFL